MPDNKTLTDKWNQIKAARATLAESEKTHGKQGMQTWDVREKLIALEAEHNDLVRKLAPHEQEKYIAALKE